METLNEHDQHVARVAADLAIKELRPLVKESLALGHRVVKAVGVIGLILLIGGTVGWKIADDQTDKIQQSRLDGFRDSCRANNERNRRTKLKLGQVSTGGPSGGQTKADLRRQIEATKQLIDALAPVTKDCDALARSRVSTR